MSIKMIQIISYNYVLEIIYYENNTKCGEVYLHKIHCIMWNNEKSDVI